MGKGNGNPIRDAHRSITKHLSNQFAWKRLLESQSRPIDEVTGVEADDLWIGEFNVDRALKVLRSTTARARDRIPDALVQFFKKETRQQLPFFSGISWMEIRSG